MSRQLQSPTHQAGWIWLGLTRRRYDRGLLMFVSHPAGYSTVLESAPSTYKWLLINSAEVFWQLLPLRPPIPRDLPVSPVLHPSELNELNCPIIPSSLSSHFPFPFTASPIPSHLSPFLRAVYFLAVVLNCHSRFLYISDVHVRCRYSILQLSIGPKWKFQLSTHSHSDVKSKLLF